MTQKIVLSKEGVDAGTATDPNDLTFSSDYNTFKYYASGSIQLDFTVGTPIDIRGTVNHNLGYIPVFNTYVNDTFISSTEYYPAPLAFEDVSGFIRYMTYANTADLEFVITATGNSTASTVTFDYKIFRNDTGL